MTDLVRVTGADKIASNLHQLADDLTDWTAVNRRAADTVASAARRRAPRRTGRLAGSVRTSVTADGATVIVGVPYARPVAARNPFFTEAISTTGSKVDSIYAADFHQAVTRAGG